MTPSGDRVLRALRGDGHDIELAQEACRVVPRDVRVRGAFVHFVRHVATGVDPGAVDRVAPLIDPVMPSMFGMTDLGDGVAVTLLLAQVARPDAPLAEGCAELLHDMVRQHADTPVMQAIARMADGCYHTYLRTFDEMAALIWSGETIIDLPTRESAVVSHRFPVAGVGPYFTPGFMRGMLDVFGIEGTIELVRHDIDVCEIHASWSAAA